MMTRRIKVTGYINGDDLNPDDYDDAHPSGLSDKGYTYVATMTLADILSDLVIEREEES